MFVRATVLALVAGLTIGAAGAAAKNGANLRVSQLDPAPQSLAAGDSFRVEGKLRNSGKRGSPAKVRVLLSGPQEAVLAELLTGPVPPKSTREFQLNATVPGGLPSGTYRLVACVRKNGTTGKERCRTAKGKIALTGGTAFTPGARSLGDPLFPQTGNGGYDAGHYDIELSYDPVTNLFGAARTTISATATQNLSEFSFDFQDQLEVSSVTVNGQPATFAFAPTPQLGTDPDITQLTKLVVTPPAGIPDGSDFEVVVTYTGEPVLMTDADLSVEGWIPACFNPGPTCDGAFVVNQPNGSQTWFPGNNYPTDKATFETSITVPTSHTAFGIGELDSRVNNGDGTWTWTWGEDDPTPTYLTTATVGLFDYSAGSVPEDQTGRVLPFYTGVDSSYPQSPTKDNVAATQALTGSMLNFLSDEYLPYPLDSIGSVVDRASGVGYALEVQTKPSYAAVGGTSQDISDFTQLHEIAHMWFGNTVTLEQWTDIWFNEGFATWSEWIWDFEENGGTASPADMFDELYANPTFDWAMAPAVLDGDPANLFDSATYDRGAMVVEGTRQILGDDGFDEFVDELFARYGYGNISTQEYIALAEELSGFSGAELDLLGDFYDQWLYGTEQPTILPSDFGPSPRSASDGSPDRLGAAPAFPGDGR
ncbi:MAG TPA: M1 family metallopeptidase [Solirubrobacterales bacterium]|nr:M1 family metallopeptidase [Solirubrobacterales bacterium]